MSQRKELRKILEKAGYKLVRSKRHFIYKNEKGKVIIMPNHNKINKHTFNGIMKKIKKRA